MAKRDHTAVPPLPENTRLVIPVMGAAGGSGRSTVAGLVASAMARAGPTVVLDTAARLASPWPSWCPTPGKGLASIPADRPLRQSEVSEAAAKFVTSAGSWDVLTDHQEWSAPPLDLPRDPAAWYQLAAIGGWRVVLADSSHALAHDIVTARCAAVPGLTAAWSSLPLAVPIFCAAATGSGVQALQQAVRGAEAEGLPLARLVIALVDLNDGRPPPVVRAAITMLTPRVASVIEVPYDPALRVGGLREVARLRPRTHQAAAALAQAVVRSAQSAWGTPLAAADQPAPHYSSSPEPAHP